MAFGHPLGPYAYRGLPASRCALPWRAAKENRPLPARWRYKHRAYYYRVPPGLEPQWDGKKEFRLGTTLGEAYRAWAERVGPTERLRNLDAVFDRYLREVVPLKSYGSQDSNRYSIQRLRPVFAQMAPNAVYPTHAYKYYGLVAQKHGPTTAKHDIQCLRHVLTKCVEWGEIHRNPLLGQLRLPTRPARDRLVEDWEVRECLMLESKIRSRAVILAKLYIRFKLMTGLRRTDILRMRLSQIREDGIHVVLSKTRKKTQRRLIIEWDDAGELRALVHEIFRLPPRRIGDAALFVTRNGKSYIDEHGRANAFDSLWTRFMDRVIERTEVTARFQERDLRAKVASDSGTLVEASERLGHASTNTTQQVYRRRPVRVQPLVRPTKR